MKVAVYALEGMRYWGGVAATLFDAPLFVQVPVPDSYDTVYIIGMYDAPMYDTTLQHTKDAKKRIIMWCGTDVQFLPHDSAMVLPEATHLCDSENLRVELWDKGVEAAVVPWPAPHHFDVKPLPELPTVAFYMGNDPEKYGWCLLHSALDILHEEQGDIGLATYSVNEYTPEQMQELVEKSTVYVRLTEHDGGAMSAKEFMEAGRKVICTADLKYATRVRHDDLVGLLAALRKALKTTEPDYEASAYWKAQNSVERWRKQMGEYVDGLV